MPRAVGNLQHNVADRIRRDHGLGHQAGTPYRRRIDDQRGIARYLQRQRRDDPISYGLAQVLGRSDPGGHLDRRLVVAAAGNRVVAARDDQPVQGPVRDQVDSLRLGRHACDGQSGVVVDGDLVRDGQ